MSVATLALAAMVMAEGAHAANYFTKHDLFTSAASPQSILSQVHVVKAPSGLNTLNSFLTGADTNNDAMLNGTACTGRSFFATCYDTPAIGSGFTLHSIGSDGTIHVTGVTDRGPNQDCGDISDDWNLGVGNRQYTYPTGYGGPSVTSGKGFPVAKFSPTIVKGKLDKTNLKFEIEASCPLKRTTAPAGFTTYVTGLPTRSADDTPYDGWCRTQLTYDEGGLDMEDIQPIPGTSYGMIVDEYSPSISVVNMDFSDTTNCGSVKVRYVPEGISLPNAGYTVKDIMPRSYDQRRSNRGLEGVAVSPDGKTAAAFMQSCMDVRNATYRTEAGLPAGSTQNGRDCEYTVVLFLNITNPLDAKVLGTKLYPLDHWSSWPGNTGFGNMDSTKVSAALWLGSDYGVKGNKQVIAVLERHKSVRIHIADFSDAQYFQESQLSVAAATVLQYKTNVTAKLGKNVIATKKFLIDTALVDGYSARGEGTKIEGFAFLNNYTILMANDNDFGLEANADSTVDIIRLNHSIAEVHNPSINTPVARSSAGVSYAATAAFGAVIAFVFA